MRAFLAVVMTIFASCGAIGAAFGEAGPSVLVETAPLRSGSLPQIVTAYGSVEAGSAGHRTVMAPAAALIGEIDVRQGEQVAANAPLLRILPTAAMAASYAQATSALRVADQLVARTGNLVAGHLATRQQLADAEKTRADARAALDALAAQGAGGPRMLRAPFPAIVLAIATHQGAIVAEGSSLIDLARSDALVLRVGVVPAQAGAISAGDKVAVTEIGGHAPIAATVALRGSVVDPTTGLVPVDIAIPPGALLPGEMAQAAITTGEAKGYVVPHDAILVDQRGAPYVVQAVHETAKKVAIRVLGAVGDQNVIAGALDPAAPLVLSGNYQLEDGMKIRLADPNAKAGP
jgi:membrane fusion protein, multidrug efflux system